VTWENAQGRDRFGSFDVIHNGNIACTVILIVRRGLELDELSRGLMGK
jgi:hypothetical protein